MLFSMKIPVKFQIIFCAFLQRKGDVRNEGAVRLVGYYYNSFSRRHFPYQLRRFHSVVTVNALERLVKEKQPEIGAQCPYNCSSPLHTSRKLFHRAADIAFIKSRPNKCGRNIGSRPFCHKETVFKGGKLLKKPVLLKNCGYSPLGSVGNPPRKGFKPRNYAEKRGLAAARTACYPGNFPVWQLCGEFVKNGYFAVSLGDVTEPHFLFCCRLLQGACGGS